LSLKVFERLIKSKLLLIKMVIQVSLLCKSF